MSPTAPYPNPARGAATVASVVAEAGPVRLAVYDMLGQEVAVALAAPLRARSHEATLPTSALAAGPYAGRLEAGGTVTSQRITDLR